MHPFLSFFFLFLFLATTINERQNTNISFSNNLNADKGNERLNKYNALWHKYKKGVLLKTKRSKLNFFLFVICTVFIVLVLLKTMKMKRMLVHKSNKLFEFAN